MALIEWTDALSVGIASIDAEHRQLIAIINDFHDAMMQREARTRLHETFLRLSAYTEQHFKHEEDLFDRYAYPEADAHKAQHAVLRGRIEELEAAFNGGKDTITIEVMEFLRDWLRNHVALSDRRYVPFLKERGIE